MARVYATSSQYQEYTGQAPPTDIDVRLRDASEFLDAAIFQLCWYDADATTGMPTNTTVLAAFANACCAQARWGVDVGDTTGAAAVGWGDVEIGSVKLRRSVTATTGDDAPARQVAPRVWDALRNPDLTRDVFWLGAVFS